MQKIIESQEDNLKFVNQESQVLVVKCPNVEKAKQIDSDVQSVNHRWNEASVLAADRQKKLESGMSKLKKMQVLIADK